MTIEEMTERFTREAGLPPAEVTFRDQMLAAIVATGIPDRLMAGLARYIQRGVRPGDFLYSVLCNDLKEAVLRADPASLVALPDLMKWLHWEAPPDCYGSHVKVEAWMAGFRKEVA